MPAPYTPESVKALRFAADTGSSRANVRESLGWDDGMIDRVCARHGISLVSAAPAIARLSDNAPPENQTPVVSKTAEVSGRNRKRKRTCQTTANVTAAISVATKNEFGRIAEAQRESISGYVADLLEEALLSGQALTCPAYDGDPRTSWICTTITTSVRDDVARVAVARHTTVGSLIAAILEAHLRALERRGSQV